MSDQKYCGTKELFAMDKLSNYNSDVVLKLAKYFKKNSQVFEFGAGIGTLAKIWRDKIGSSPDCLEIDCDLGKIIHNLVLAVMKILMRFQKNMITFTAQMFWSILKMMLVQ